jgi:integrase
MGYEKGEMTAHGFRAMARTILEEVLHVQPEIIEHQLAHVVRDSLGRAYNRTTHLAARKKMMQTWADYLDNLKTMRHCCFGGFLVSKTDTKNAATLTLPVFA